MSVLSSVLLPARHLAGRGRQAPARPTELALVQLTLVSDELGRALAQLGAVGRLQAASPVVTEAFTFSYGRGGEHTLLLQVLQLLQGLKLQSDGAATHCTGTGLR